MSDKEVFLAQVHKLVAWLKTCQLPDVQAGRDVQASDYNEKFFKWLTVRFATKHGRRQNGIQGQLGKTKEERELLLHTTPQMWIEGLEAACAHLHEVKSFGNSRLLVIEMTDYCGAHPPVQHVPYYDKIGVFNLEFICAKESVNTTGRHQIRLTDVGQGTYGNIGSKCFWGGTTRWGTAVDVVDCNDDTREYLYGGDRYGVSSTKDCCVFEHNMSSDYFALHDENERLLLTIHRVDTVPVVEHPVVAAQSLKERDPARYVQRRMEIHALMGKHFKLPGR